MEKSRTNYNICRILLTGMIVGPFALGAFFLVDGKPLLQINDEIKFLGFVGSIVILFMAGLEMTPKEFLKGDKASFTVSTLGVIVPFFAGLDAATTTNM